MHRRRARRDRFARWLIGFGGLVVIAAITVMFFYLAYVVVPLFQSASTRLTDAGRLADAGSSEPLFLALEEQKEAGLLLSAWLWHRYGTPLRRYVPDGFEPLLQLPVLIGLTVLAFAVADPLQYVMFGQDLRSWLTRVAGIDYDQRNALAVGCAMGFAVIPTIFTIAEDAMGGVPGSLSNGSLALGATPWQTVLFVVLPTASPGIFSALMIGFGRAVGETMIVLMATGSTPIMDWNVFEGMRTLAANIAVELPESEVASTHFRILFLAALVLFVFTFAVNTVADVVRQRLRRRYGSL